MFLGTNLVGGKLLHPLHSIKDKIPIYHLGVKIKQMTRLRISSIQVLVFVSQAKRKNTTESNDIILHFLQKLGVKM